jgi:hypothetical protein
MDLDIGKKLFDSFAEAEKVAVSMRRSHKEAFKAYRVGNQWAVGGVHVKSSNKKVKVTSLDDIRALLYEYKESEEDSSVEDYIAEIANESTSKTSSIQGESDDWLLRKVELKFGHEIHGMSANNKNTYLVLTLTKAKEELTLKMGGNFSRHIPLVKKQAESLVGNTVFWHTWNSKTSTWGSNEWFYLIERKN